MASQNRPKARRAAGFVDVADQAAVVRGDAIETLVQSFKLWGFAPLETPAIEYLDVLGKHLPDEDAPDDGVFALRDDDEQWLALRYDLTAPLARYVAENRQHLPTPFRRYQVGPVWRREKPGPGRFRQFTQCDFDTVGSANPAVEAEACSLISAALVHLGLGLDEHEVRVNDRKVLNGVLGNAGVTDTDQQFSVLRAIDKLDRLGLDAVRELLSSGRMDSSGDFTTGSGLAVDQVDAVAAFLEAGSNDRGQVVESLRSLVGSDPVGNAGVDELAAIAEALEAMGVGPQVVFDPAVVRGLAYYTGPVFEAALTFEVTDEKGRVREFGSVAGGGRYDDLISRFVGQPIPACGASIGVDRLLAALSAREEVGTKNVGPVIITVMDSARRAEYHAMAAELRAAGIAAEAYVGTQNLQKQLKYADRRGAQVVVIAGEDEFAAGQIQIKDLFAGAQRAAEITDRETWRADQSAQRLVPRAELVLSVRSILDL